MASGHWAQSYTAPRRIQFSSCDSCRKARVACDASKFGHNSRRASWNSSCSRCAVRSQRCTFEWISKSTRNQQRNREGQPSHGTHTEDSIEIDDSPQMVANANLTHDSSQKVVANDVSCFSYPQAPFTDDSPTDQNVRLIDVVSLDSELVDMMLRQCTDVVFHQTFGAVFGRWVGRYGCPLLDEMSRDLSIPPVDLFANLDSYLNQQLPQSPAIDTTADDENVRRDEPIDRCLHHAMQAYASRWLSIFGHSKYPIQQHQFNEIVRSTWRAARTEMLKAINRPSYRSVLALYLFGETPVPIGISKEEELNGISGVVCCQTAMLQVQQLRERLRSCQFNGAEVSPWTDATINSTTARASCNFTEDFLDLESRAYWATVTWDTSSTMTLNFRSTLSSGLKGACSEPVWRLARGYLVGSFHTQTEEWRNQGVRISNEIAPRIISAAAICGIYSWRTFASLKEALREGVEEDSVQVAWKSVLDAIEIFKTTVQPLLRNCERQLHFLDQVDRLNWYEITLIFYLGVLLAVDTLEAARRLDLVQQITQLKAEAEDESINILKLGLESDYTITGSRNESNITLDFMPLTVSFLAIDPYPHHVTALVHLVHKAIFQKRLEGDIKETSYFYLRSILLKALEQLPQSSKAVMLAEENFLQLSHIPTTLGL